MIADLPESIPALCQKMSSKMSKWLKGPLLSVKVPSEVYAIKYLHVKNNLADTGCSKAAFKGEKYCLLCVLVTLQHRSAICVFSKIQTFYNIPTTVQG